MSMASADMLLVAMCEFLMKLHWVYHYLWTQQALGFAEKPCVNVCACSQIKGG